MQVLVREPKGRWIVEVIPKEMYLLKNSCGHTGYTKYRCLLIVASLLRNGGNATTVCVFVFLGSFIVANHPNDACLPLMLRP